MLREKFTELANRLKEAKENDLVSELHEIIDSCGKYVEKVNSMEAVITIQRFRLEGEDYRQMLIDADKNRRIYHNSLIVNVKLLNRYCKLAEMEPIFTGDLESRIEIAEFAMEAVKEMFDTRKR